MAQRPVSAVSEKTGLVGAATLAGLLVLAYVLQLEPLTAALLFMGGLALSMGAWSILVERTHERASSGLDFTRPRPFREALALTAVRLAGLIATFAAIAVMYFALRSYTAVEFSFYFAVLVAMLPLLAALAPIYLFATTRVMVEPKDGLYEFGRLVLLDWKDRDWSKIAEHGRSWTIKAFFLAFMMSILPVLVNGALGFKAGMSLVEAMLWLVSVMYLFDVAFGALGYMLTLRPLDSHIRSSNPYVLGWVAALACYPPFSVVGGGPLDYHEGGQRWTDWFAGQDLLLLVWGGAILALTALYVWSTVIFGVRFSNLTHRGVLTNGPFRWFKHPAYLSKNVFWWLTFLPFLSTTGWEDAVRNSILLALVNAVYFVRAKTEERHLMSDPDYQAYAAWIEDHGLLPRARRALMRLARRSRTAEPGRLS